MKQKAKLVFSVSTCLLASHIIHPHSNLALAGRLTPAQLQLVLFEVLKLKHSIFQSSQLFYQVHVSQEGHEHGVSWHFASV